MAGLSFEREEGVTCVVCPSCVFTFDASHKDADRDGYTCPNCGADDKDPYWSESSQRDAAEFYGKQG